MNGADLGRIVIDVLLIAGLWAEFRAFRVDVRVALKDHGERLDDQGKQISFLEGLRAGGV